MPRQVHWLTEVLRGCAAEKSWELERGDHAGDGVVEGGAAIEIGLPEAREKLKVFVPAARVETFANGVGNVRIVGSGRRTIGASIAGALRRLRGRRFGAQQRLDDFAGGIEKKRVPEVARNGFAALTAFARDGRLHGLGEAVRRFVKENFKGFVALVARIGAGDGDAERIERGVGAGPVGESGDVHASFAVGPLGFINEGEALGNSDALLFD